MSKYEYNSPHEDVPDSQKVMNQLVGDHPVEKVISDGHLKRIIVKTSRELTEEEKEEVDQIVRDLIGREANG